MVYYSPQLIHTMRAALEAVMTQVPMSHATPGFKVHTLPNYLAGGRAGRDKLRWLSSRGIGNEISNDYLDAHLIEKKQCGIVDVAARECPVWVSSDRFAVVGPRPLLPPTATKSLRCIK